MTCSVSEVDKKVTRAFVTRKKGFVLFPKEKIIILISFNFIFLFSNYEN